jgi:predicted membrane channel-forming protein YqfA (hemolysin III family)
MHRSHIVGFVLFLVYALVRHGVANDDSTAGALTSGAAWTAALTFALSSFYHATNPDRELSTMTRILDYLGIYVGIVVTSLADIAVVTKGFVGVPWIAILDIPLGAIAIFLFFLWRRIRLPRDVTWQSDRGQCTIGFGLFTKGHGDQNHGPARETTSLLLALAYFLVVPAAIAVLGWNVAVIVLALQGAAFLILLFGMIVDRVLQWPDAQLAAGTMRCLVCTACSCVLHSHAVWHLLALLAAVLGAVAREYALHNS